MPGRSHFRLRASARETARAVSVYVVGRRRVPKWSKNAPARAGAMGNVTNSGYGVVLLQAAVSLDSKPSVKMPSNGATALPAW